jgi:hypothetical protein
VALAVAVADRVAEGESDVGIYRVSRGASQRWLAMVRRLRTILAGDPGETMDPLW